ncbi:MAG: Hpt domain-containing protein [Acidobacteriota bacterium]|nr:Hpt domain-containing protein [Acidobacteriota bacterium]
MSTNHAEVDKNTGWELAPSAQVDVDAVATDAIDVSVLRGFEQIQAEGEPDIVVELIDLYLEDAPRKLASMWEAAAGADEQSLKRAAHSLKGSSASLGAGQVASLCYELERAYCVDSSEQAAALLDRMGREMERARRAFEAERRRRS